MQEYKIKVSEEESGKRLDIFLNAFSKDKNIGLSRTSLQRLIRDGNIVLNGSSKMRPNYAVKNGDEIIITIEDKQKSSVAPERIPLDVVYQDNDIAVINKPCGLVVHPAPGNYEHTLVNALLHHFKKLSDINPDRPGIVHRLDKDTSGLLVIAKNNPSHLILAKQFSEHSIKRRYVAIVKGKVEFNEGVVEMPIGRHPHKRKDMAVSFAQNSKYAKTCYRTLKRGDQFSLLELEPFTGRTHQLRVHLTYIGHPILGDTKYGRNNEFSRLALHAKYIGFIHPTTNKFMEFSCPVPKEFDQLLESK